MVLTNCRSVLYRGSPFLRQTTFQTTIRNRNCLVIQRCFNRSNNHDPELNKSTVSTQITAENKFVAEFGTFHYQDILVETSMLAALSGICALLLGLLRLEGYMYYLLPFPLVLSAVRSGPAASIKTLFATFFLLLILMGPPRAVAYLLLFGAMGVVLGWLWHQRLPWWITIPACTAAGILSTFSYIFIASYLVKENIFKLVIYNVYSAVVKTSAICGTQVTPSGWLISMALIGFLAIRNLFYVSILQLCYANLLTNMGYEVGSLPEILEKLIKRETRG